MYILFLIRGIRIIWLTVNKAHDVASSLMCDLDVIRLFRKYPRLLGAVYHRTTDRTRFMTILPAATNNVSTKIYQSYDNYVLFTISFNHKQH